MLTVTRGKVQSTSRGKLGRARSVWPSCLNFYSCLVTLEGDEIDLRFYPFIPLRMNEISTVSENKGQWEPHTAWGLLANQAHLRNNEMMGEEALEAPGCLETPW